MKLRSFYFSNLSWKSLIQNRWMIGGIYFLCFLPTLLAAFAISRQKEQLEEAKAAIDCLVIKMERLKELQKDQHQFFKTYGEVDPYYLDHAIESMQFLKPEVEALRLVVSSPAFKACDRLKQRLQMLSQGNNAFIFSEGPRKTVGKLEETELFQKRPVELSRDDLKQVLSVVEGIPIGEVVIPPGRPQMIVKQFHLSKKKLAERETYQLEMQLIKRGKIQ
ncbi:MAG: hypothetical protein KDK64_04875 [Chlamydiia bacterium]|nr:hypothetical protein [Chlamydiia bacterium]